MFRACLEVFKVFRWRLLAFSALLGLGFLGFGFRFLGFSLGLMVFRVQGFSELKVLRVQAF